MEYRDRIEYKITSHLSSREFYRMLDVLSGMLRENCLCILDFSGVKRVDAVVIPNLLILGKIIESRTRFMPVIRLGENLESGYLKNYMLNIRFFELSDMYYKYEDYEGRTGGLVGKKMSEQNTTVRFLYEEGFEIAQRRFFYELMPFINTFLKVFNQDVINSNNLFFDNCHLNNSIAFFLKETIENTFIHAKSDTIITVQIDYKMQKVYISISDCGKGFLKAQLENMDSDGNFIDKGSDDPGVNILNRRPKTEEEAIFIGLFKRVRSKEHGLINIARRIMRLKGIIRIHSNDCRVILTERLQDMLLDHTIVEKREQIREYNIIKTSDFKGAHFEIELPLESIGSEK